MGNKMSDTEEIEQKNENSNGFKKLLDLLNPYSSLAGVIINLTGIISIFLAFTYERSYLKWFNIDIKKIDIDFVGIIYGCINKFIGSLLIVGAYFHIIYTFQQPDGKKVFFKRLWVNLIFEFILSYLGYIVFSELYSNIFSRSNTFIAIGFLACFYVVGGISCVISFSITKKNLEKKAVQINIVNFSIALIIVPLIILYIMPAQSGSNNAKKQKVYKTISYQNSPYVVLYETKSQYIISPCIEILKKEEINNKITLSANLSDIKKTTEANDVREHKVICFNLNNKEFVDKNGIATQETVYDLVSNTIPDDLLQKNDTAKLSQ
jgi:hypothetical protein